MNLQDNPSDRLWAQYGKMFDRFDDHTLARWLVQTLGHFNGAMWRYSHPLVGAYKLAAQTANQRQIWLKRLVDIPSPFLVADCCRSPLFPLVTRDVKESGLICMHCNETLIAMDEVTAGWTAPLTKWAKTYAAVHRIAHLDEKERESDYEKQLDDAADKAGQLLIRASTELFPKLLDQYPAFAWEDHDECLGVRPEDLI